jgi:hypothetical protein
VDRPHLVYDNPGRPPWSRLSCGGACRPNLSREQRMKRFFLPILVLAALAWGLCGQSWAKTLVFQGKSFSTNKEEINWPFGSAPPAGGSKYTQLYNSVQPAKSVDDKSAEELGSDLPYLRIMKVNVRIGQHVSHDEPLFSYVLPLDKIIKEKQAFSRSSLVSLEGSLAQISYKLSSLSLKQEQVEKGISLKTVASAQQRITSLDYESLLKRRDVLSLSYELAVARYDENLDLARKRYGAKFDPKHFPTTAQVTSKYDGTVLWINPSLVPGMIFSKKAQLFVIGQLDPVHIKAVVYEIDLHKVKVGDQATVTFNSLPGFSFPSTIDSINYVAQTNDPQVPVYYEIELYVPNHDLHIKEGMRCEVAVNAPDTPQ